MHAVEFLIGTALALKRRAQSSSDCSGTDDGDQVEGNPASGTPSGIRNQNKFAAPLYRWIMFINGRLRGAAWGADGIGPVSRGGAH
ncbi:hypothetical protein MPL3356_420016 [Mesorhizobium plurifarium]|uniref:Uncharacterized protein n=1 Tax=Mesorhizobium plurifarium TaxID=69974 RepID=A0A090EB78_MESPL|nr:hypothetical protein MPL3356_420016 [Mesorhizobium plurifarium]